MKPRESAGGVVVNSKGQVALVEQHGNSWSFPKGGVEPGEDYRAAAMREIFEETGLRDITFVRELGSYERYSLGPDGKSEATELGLRKRVFFLFTTADE